MARFASFARFAVVLAALAVWPAAPADAQSIGVFRWQMQPYCNVVTLSVMQQGGLYTLTGTDDLCGTPRAASAVGAAFMNPDGSVGLGLTLVTNNDPVAAGTPIHVDATIALSSLSGTWRDSAGNIGAFTITQGASTPGSPRPIPSGGVAPGSITSVQIAPTAVGAAQLADGAVTTAKLADGAVTTAHLATPPSVGLVSSDQLISLTPFVQTLVRSVSVPIPTFGRVIVTASGFLRLDSAGFDAVICSITTGIVTDITQEIRLDDFGNESSRASVPFSSTRAFLVNGTESGFNLVCRNASSGSVSVHDTTMTALYIAQ